ncbi:hypothetical protein CANCADRAFT_1306 [Tortispora caseinolytica NRRL Y-17796]|uniref:Uncharacterized protein n=1 Tax=Tortispora caseinolytica NRRL Y-17796 TaxID=767744 RepID=A0A1E4TLR9_9ASCO|nr:hypothetical protein CANCADRAFT_1306 [Tortispora caseinolytica NRRL Y-17796]
MVLGLLSIIDGTTATSPRALIAMYCEELNKDSIAIINFLPDVEFPWTQVEPKGVKVHWTAINPAEQWTTTKTKLNNVPLTDIVVVVFPEVAIAAGTVASQDLVAALDAFRVRGSHLVVATQPAILDDETRFRASIFSKANDILTVRPLKTGKAKDVTGRIRHVRGPQWYPGSLNRLDPCFYKLEGLKIKKIYSL